MNFFLLLNTKEDILKNMSMTVDGEKYNWFINWLPIFFKIKKQTGLEQLNYPFKSVYVCLYIWRRGSFNAQIAKNVLLYGLYERGPLILHLF